MRKFILFLVMSNLLLPPAVISTEREFEPSKETVYQLHNRTSSAFYDQIPDNPNVFEKTKTYADKNLNQAAGELQPNQVITIESLQINDQLEPVFQLANQRYVLASQDLFFDDIALAHAYDTADFWTKPGLTVYTSPIGNKAKKAASKLGAYSKVTVTETIRTPRGEFAKTADGWIDVRYLSAEDNRMEKVQSLLTSKYNKANYSVYVQQLDTGLTAGINQNKIMYSASVAKLATLYYTQLQLDQGSLKLTDTLKYTEAVNKTDSSYRPEGSGSLPKTANDKPYSIDQLIQETAKQSDNVASNILSYYVTKQFDADYYKTMDALLGQRWDMDSRDGSAQMAGQIMAALYAENSSGPVLESLSSTAYDGERIAKNIPVKVAHKIGDAYDFKHDVAVVYADSPFVLAIYTDNASYDTISDIADDVYAVLK